MTTHSKDPEEPSWSVRDVDMLLTRMLDTARLHVPSQASAVCNLDMCLGLFWKGSCYWVNSNKGCSGRRMQGGMESRMLSDGWLGHTL